MHCLASCAEDESQSCSLEYQGFCLEPIWQWPSWDSAAPLRPLARVHPNGGVSGSCGSGYSFRIQQALSQIYRKYLSNILGNPPPTENKSLMDQPNKSKRWERVSPPLLSKTLGFRKPLSRKKGFSYVL